MTPRTYSAIGVAWMPEEVVKQVIQGVDRNEYKRRQAPPGVKITARAFAQLGAFAPYLLCIAVAVFAYSTMISWGYYGERAAE